jgi:carboxyl-terminal processing protease
MTNLQKFEIFALVFAVSVGTFFGGFFLGKRGYNFELQTNPPLITFTNTRPADQTIDFSQFWEVYNSLNDKYLLTPLDGQSLVNGAIKGMVSSAGDPFTSYFDPQDNKQFNESLDGVYEGIGAELGYNEQNQLMIISPIDGSPAKEAGIRPGDLVLKINEESTYGISLADAVGKIRGTGGTNVKLTIARDSGEILNLDLTRRKITMKSVSWEDKGDGIAYIRISRFGNETNNHWDEVVKETYAKMTEFDSVIIDVRGNPGGLLHSAVYIAGEFYSKKPAIFFEDKAGRQESVLTRAGGKFQNLSRVIVMIDEGSASASEILAGALKVEKQAVILGKNSFGKGTIQEPIDFKDGSSLHVTVQKWLIPDRTWIHQVGLAPDVDVDLDRKLYTEEKKDTQLEKAIEELKK